MIAIVTATSGAAPAITDARAGPASRTREHEQELRASRGEQAGEQERPELAAPLAADERDRPRRRRSRSSAVANAPTRASRLRRIEKPSATDIPPKSRAEARASATPDTRPNLTG